MEPIKCKECGNNLLSPVSLGLDKNGIEQFANRHCPSGVCFDCHDCDLEST